MKARFTDEQFIAMIKEQEAGEKTADVCRGMRCPVGFCKQKPERGSVLRRFTNTNQSMAG